MNFTLTKEQEAVQKLMREFAEKEIAPSAHARDLGQDYAPTFEILKKMGSMGLWGLCYPKEVGGTGGDFVSYSIAQFEINRVDVSTGTSYAVHMSLGTYPLFKFGTPEQKEKWLRPALEGKKLTSFGLTEPNAGSDAAMQETVAVLDGDEYVLNGTKCFITNSGFSEIYTVFAMTDKSKGVKGISAFIVEKDHPGFTFGKQEVKMGIRSTVQRELLFKDCRLPKSHLLGKEGEGFKIAMMALDYGRIGVAAQGAGVAWGAFECALKYAKERVQFGRPIIQNQAMHFMLADMATDIEAAKLLILKASDMADRGMNFTREIAMAKLFATDVGMRTTTNAVQIYGGAGFLNDHPVERMMRDAKILQIYEGTNQVQRMVIAGGWLRG